MCFRPPSAEAGESVCPSCFMLVRPTPEGRCPDCGGVMAPGVPTAPSAPKAPGAPEVPGAPKAPMPPSTS